MKKAGKWLLSGVPVSTLVMPNVLVAQPAAAAGVDQAKIDEIFAGANVGHFRSVLTHDDIMKFKAARNLLRKPESYAEFDAFFNEHGLSKATLGADGAEFMRTVFLQGTILTRDNFRTELDKLKGNLTNLKDITFDANIVAEYVITVQQILMANPSLNEGNYKPALAMAMLTASLKVPGINAELKKIFPAEEGLFDFIVALDAKIDSKPVLKVARDAFVNAMVRYVQKLEQTTPPGQEDKEDKPEKPEKEEKPEKPEKPEKEDKETPAPPTDVPGKRGNKPLTYILGR